MTDQEANMAVAELCGWEFHPECGPLDLPWYHRPTVTRAANVPDYGKCLNACHEMECALQILPGFRDVDEVRDCYARKLQEVVWRGDDFHQGFKVINATAAQRREAFLRVHGKWEEK